MGKVVLHCGQRFKSYSYVGMINKIFKTDHKMYIRSSFKLDDYGKRGYIAWIVYLNNEWHSNWKNNIVEDKIIEECNDIEKFLKDAKKYPKRLVFSRCPKTSGECVFIGTAYLKSVDFVHMTKEYSLVRKEEVLVI